VRQALERTLGVPIFQEQVMQLAILAADFTPGEADQLRRAMAAWKRRGGLGPFHERLVGRMVEKGYARDYAEAIFRQIEGFGEYGFPESHAASFALLVYASAWLKCHHPDAFLAALLDSQPMGFYAPAQLVRDAREHGVQLRPVDVRRSGWETALEAPGSAAAPASEAAHPAPPGLHPVRLGLNRIAGLPEAAARRIVAARPFDSVEDLARRAALDAQALRLLAQAGALAGLAGHRHEAAWAVAGVDTRASALLRSTRTHEEAAELATPAVVEETLADYRAMGLTLGTHPLALLRGQLQDWRVQTAATLKQARPGQLAPPAPRDGQGRGLRDAGGRHGQRQRHRLARPCARAAPRAAGQPAAHGLRRVAARGRGAPPGGQAAAGPQRTAAGVGRAQPGLPLKDAAGSSPGWQAACTGGRCAGSARACAPLPARMRRTRHNPHALPPTRFTLRPCSSCCLLPRRSITTPRCPPRSRARPPIRSSPRRPPS
jgi:hypothetical protein